VSIAVTTSFAVVSLVIFPFCACLNNSGFLTIFLTVSKSTHVDFTNHLPIQLATHLTGANTISFHIVATVLAALIGLTASCKVSNFDINCCPCAVLPKAVTFSHDLAAHTQPNTAVNVSNGFCVIVSIAASAVQKFLLKLSHIALTIAFCSSVPSTNHNLSATHTHISLTLLAVQTTLLAIHNISHTNCTASHGKLAANLALFNKCFPAFFILHKKV